MPCGKISALIRFRIQLYMAMRKVMLAALAAMAMVSVKADDRDWGNFNRYAESNREVMASDASQRRVVFLGNSITDGWASVHPEFFSKNGFVGRGISGQTSYQFLVRFRDDVINLHPQAVVINAATNDVAENTHPYNADRTMGNIISMVELAEANGIKVIMTTTLPAAGFGWNRAITDAPDKIAALNARMKEYAASKGIPFVDYYSAMVTDDGRRALRPELSDDGVHPTPGGYDLMESIVLPVVEQTIGKKK